MEGFAPVFSSSRSFEDDDEEDILCDHVDASSLDGFATSGGERDLSDGKRHRGHYDSDRRNRREIANSNERKRMQSINAGFQSLRGIVCPKMGEKLSKAAILKYAAEFIHSLMRDKQQLTADKRHLEQVLTGAEPGRRCHSSSSFSISSSSSRLSSTSFPSRKRWRDTESSSSDEGIGFASTDEVVVSSSSSSKVVISELQRQVCDLKQQLEMERSRRLNVEMDKERLEQLRQQQSPPPQLPLSYQRTMSSSSSSSSSSASDTLSLDHVVLVPPATTTTLPSSKDLPHSSMWRRNLETIVEAIRHVEGDSGLFAPPVPAQPELDSEVAQTEPSPTEAVHVAEPLSEIQVHPVWLQDLASQSFLSSPDTVRILHSFHRPSLTVPSS